MDNFGIGQVVVVAQDTVTYQRIFSCSPDCNCVSRISFRNIARWNRVETNFWSGVLLKVVSTSRQVTVALLRSSYSDPRDT